MIRKFIFKATILMLPFAIFACVTIALGIWFGDLLFTSQIIALQEEHNGFYRPDAQGDMVDYKLRVLLDNPADMLIMGSSRFQSILGDFVTNPDTRFYNATIPAQTPLSMLLKLEVLADHAALPEIAIMNIDLNQLNANCGELCITDFIVESPTFDHERDRLQREFQTLALDLMFTPHVVFSEIDRFRDTDARYNLGRTIPRYRLDGSVLMYLSPSVSQRTFAEHEDYWAKRDRMYSIGDILDQETLDVFRDILLLAQTHDIIIVGVLPPYHPDFYERIVTSEQHSYFNPARTALAEIFTDYDMPLYDWTDPGQSSVTEEMFYDGWHLGEVGSLVLYLDLVDANPELFTPYSDADILNDMLANVPNSYLLYEDNLP